MEPGAIGNQNGFFHLNLDILSLLKNGKFFLYIYFSFLLKLIL